MSENAPSLETPPTLESVRATYEAKREEYDKKMEKLIENVETHSSIFAVIAAERGRRERREQEQERDRKEGRIVSEMELAENEVIRSVETRLAADADFFNRERVDDLIAANKAMNEKDEQKALYIKMGGDPSDLTLSRFDIA